MLDAAKEVAKMHHDFMNTHKTFMMAQGNLFKSIGAIDYEDSQVSNLNYCNIKYLTFHTCVQMLSKMTLQVEFLWNVCLPISLPTELCVKIADFTPKFVF